MYPVLPYTPSVHNTKPSIHRVIFATKINLIQTRLASHKNGFRAKYIIYFDIFPDTSGHVINFEPANHFVSGKFTKRPGGGRRGGFWEISRWRQVCFPGSDFIFVCRLEFLYRCDKDRVMNSHPNQGADVHAFKQGLSDCAFGFCRCGVGFC